MMLNCIHDVQLISPFYQNQSNQKSTLDQKEMSYLQAPPLLMPSLQNLSYKFFSLHMKKGL